MFETPITVVGNVVDDPTLRTTTTGRSVASFRIASTARHRNPETGEYEDSHRFFASVVCWKDLAEHVTQCLRKGQPVIVHGWIATREYTKDEQVRANYEITADAVGHNLARGTTQFTRTGRPRALTSVPVGRDGLPADLAGRFLADVSAAAVNAGRAEPAAEVEPRVAATMAAGT